jgi:hypothetical protein
MARTIRSAHVRTLDVARSADVPRSMLTAAEPCVSCGEETAAGSVFFSDRQTVELPDGRTSFLCQLCDSRIRSSRRGRRLTDEEVREYVRNGSAIALGWRP